MQNQSSQILQYALFLVFFLFYFLISTFFLQTLAKADEILQSTARILSTSQNARVLSTVPQDSQNLENVPYAVRNQIHTQEQNFTPYSSQSLNPQGQNSQDTASAGFYFNMYNPYGPSISTGAYASGTSTQNAPMRRSKSQIIRVDQNNMPLEDRNNFVNIPPLHLPESPNIRTNHDLKNEKNTLGIDIPNKH